MARQKELKTFYRKRRHAHVRKKIVGTHDRPRLVVFRSLRHIYGQLVDDMAGVTLIGISSLAATAGSAPDKGGKLAVSKQTGKILAEKALKAGVKRVIFDKGGYKYHGRVKAFADGAREGGLEF
jgi:large subunit ribosomal protein L18